MKWVTIENGEMYLNIFTRNGKYIKISLTEIKNILHKFIECRICNDICYPRVDEILHGFANRFNYASSACRDLAQDCIEKIYQYILTQI